MDMKNDRKDDKTRWELMPLDCLEDIARVYTEGAKKYNDNTWQNLENGYERYKGALLRHLYAAEEIEYERNKHRRETGSDTIESTSDSTVSETDTTGHES